MRFGSIYKITNILSKESYIGQTTWSVEDRFNKHISDTRYRNTYFINCLKKYGKDNFILEELCTCLDNKSLDLAEIFFINHFNTLYPNGYNHTTGGKTGRLSEEQKIKSSKSRIGKKRGKYNPEQGLKISKAKTGKSLEFEHAQKLRNIMNSNRALYSHTTPHSIESKRKISLNKRKHWKSLIFICKKTLNKFSFETIIEAANNLNVLPSSIGNVVAKRSKSLKNYYVEVIK